LRGAPWRTSGVSIGRKRGRGGLRGRMVVYLLVALFPAGLKSASAGYWNRRAGFRCRRE